MSAEELYPNYHRADDHYATRPLALDHVAEQARPAAAASRRRRSWWLVLLDTLIVALVLALAAAIVGLRSLDHTYQGRIVPNVMIHGLQVGELTPHEAESALRGRYSSFLQQPLTLTYGDRVWRPTLAELGVEFDFDSAVESAYTAGRSDNLFDTLQYAMAIWRDGLDIPLQVSFDQRAMQRYIARVSAELERPPVDAQLRLEGTTVRTEPAQVGRQVLVDETLQSVAEALRTFTPQTVPLRTRELPPRLNDAAVAEARHQIEAMLQAPLTLTVEDRQYVWPPEEVALMLDIARVPADSGSDRIAVALNDYQIQRRIRRIADETGRGSVNPRVAWNGGNLKIIRPGKSGMRVDEARAHALIVASIAGHERTLALPVLEVTPQVTEANLHQLGIKELVSVGKSDFTGSADYRVTNIGVGMRILNGILIAPGEEFSFNENIGAINARNGFVEGYAIVQNRTQLEFGGGICQDSTTLFRAAFWAGLPITERWGHSFYISWYDKYGPTGMDATIFTGGPDLKFVNDTGTWLLLQAWSDPGSGIAQIEFYGTKPNRQVYLDQRVYDQVPAPTEPVYVPDPKQPRGAIKQTDKARGGMTIDIYRTIVEDGVKREPELFRTKFKPWPNIFLVNPRDLGPNGKPVLRRPDPPPQPAPPPEQQPPPAEQPPAPPPEQQPPPSNG